jgi:predicted enzyme related to lactoylglutathione lyase
MDVQDGLSAEELSNGAETLDLTEPGKCDTTRCDTGRCVMELLVNLDVDDLEKAIRFYGSAFGLKVGRRFGALGVEMLGSPAPIYLIVKSPGTPASDTTTQHRNYERHWTPVHLDFVVDEIEPAVERAVSAGARLEQPIATHKWGKLALMADPFGHGFCFVQFLGRGYDEIAE